MASPPHFFSIEMVHFIKGLSNIKPNVHSCDKSHLVVAYTSIYILPGLVRQYSVDNFTSLIIKKIL